ncbi:MAG TPA: glycosyltransferase [Aquabacterium sp.]|nr:glycosyltransferase [Aquabacterium sp.]
MTTHPTATAAPLQIALVTETYPPEVNGVAGNVARLVQGLRERGHRLQLVRPRQPGDAAGSSAAAPDELLLRGLPIPRYPQLRMGLPATGALLAQWRARRPDVVHIATEGPLGWSALRAARRLGLPVTSDFRTNFDAYSRHYGIGWLRGPILGYLRHFHNATQATMVPTPALQQALQGQGFAGVHVVARGVDTARFSPVWRSDALRRSWGAGAHTWVVAHVGRLAPEKNLSLLVHAYQAMRQVRPDSLLLLVGDGPARAELRAQCPGAVFAGMRSGDDLAAHDASADAFVFPSLTETFGNVTPEAMASGLPVLAYDQAAAGQLVGHGRSGLLAAPGDAQRFVALAADLALDAGRARAWGAAGRRTALACQWEQVIAQVAGWWVEDFTAAEIRADIFAQERLRDVRTANNAFNDQERIPTLQEVIDLAKAKSAELRRTIGIYPETKHPSYFAAVAQANGVQRMEDRLVSILHANYGNTASAPVYIQSFEVANLQYLNTITDIRIVQLLNGSGRPFDFVLAGDGRSYADLAKLTAGGLRFVDGYADGIGANTNLMIPLVGGRLGTPTSLVADAHSLGLEVHGWTFRAENVFLPNEFDIGTNPAAYCDMRGQVQAFTALGMDGFFTDQPDLGVAAIPEPGSWALMLAGGAGLGLLARRRRSAA